METTLDATPIPLSSITINLKKHKVMVINKNIVHIQHTKKCQTPCVDIKDIVGYLEAELFVEGVYAVSETTK